MYVCFFSVLCQIKTIVGEVQLFISMLNVVKTIYCIMGNIKINGLPNGQDIDLPVVLHQNPNQFINLDILPSSHSASIYHT